MALITITDGQKRRYNRRDAGATTADNALGHVLKTLADAIANTEFVVTDTVTLAQINAGKILVPAIDGKQILVTGYEITSVGGFADGTNVLIQDTATTPVVVVTALTAALTDGAKIASGAVIENVTDGAGYRAALTASKAVQIKATGTMTTATSLKVVLRYKIV